MRKDLVTGLNWVVGTGAEKRRDWDEGRDTESSAQRQNERITPEVDKNKGEQKSDIKLGG